MSGTKQVKVDNWGVYFLQRLKHFFNNTDYCDLTLQFRDYAQLKVHRLVLSACTKYFELLEQTCEVYDDCLIMPDDLQADVVVPIINFMYTGQLEYNYSLFDRLYSTAQIMNMTVLTKLLDAQKTGDAEPTEPRKREMISMNAQLANKSFMKPSTSDDFNNFETKMNVSGGRKYGPGPRIKYEVQGKSNSSALDAARPTRYELPEGLDTDDVFEASFSNISYQSQPLMKPSKRRLSEEDGPKNIYDEASTSRKFEELKRSEYKKARTSSMNVNQIRAYSYDQKMKGNFSKDRRMSEDESQDLFDTLINDFNRNSTPVKKDTSTSNSLNDFNQLQKNSTKIDAKNSNISMDHAKIISEVLKKYPHLVKSNKNIKLKIMSSKSSSNNSQSYVLETNKMSASTSPTSKNCMEEDEKPDWIYIPRTGNTLESMANLVAMGAENVVGPWLCFLCGTPSKALKFLTYHKYYRHLVDAHKERIPPKICEYCGFKSGKRNHLLHHMYTKHNVEPPPHYYFPKCNQCSYIALTEAFLIKHKLSHASNKDFRCGICNSSYRTRPQLLLHIQTTGHKVSPENRGTTKCTYCSKVFLRESNLYTHLKLAHKEVARKDGIIDNSEDEEEDNNYSHNMSSYHYGSDQQEEHVNIKEEFDGKIQIISNTQISKPYVKNNQKLLNTKFIGKLTEKIREHDTPLKQTQRGESSHIIDDEQNIERESVSSRNSSNVNLLDRIVVYNDNEYIIQSEEDIVYVDPKSDQIQMEQEELIVPEIVEQAQSIDISPIEQGKITQITSAAILKQSQKLDQQTHNVMTTQTQQPMQIMVSNNQQFKTIVTSAPIVYNNSSNTSIVSDPQKYLHGQLENLQLVNSQEGVVVLNEGDFQIACSESIPTDGSNIVVVYSHPIEDKQYIEINNHQIENIADSQEVESQLERLHSDEVPMPMSDQGVVHETVETWHEETIEESTDVLPESREEDLNESSDKNIPDETKEVIEEANVSDHIEQSEDVENDILQESIVTSEVEISPDEKHEQNNEAAEIMLNFDINMDNNIENKPIEKSSEDQDANDELHSNYIDESAIECIDSNNTHDYAIQKENEISEPIPTETINDCNLDATVSEITGEWSDDDASKKQQIETTIENQDEQPTIPEEEEKGVSDIIPEEISESVCQMDVEGNVDSKDTSETFMEIEESIENIQEEINKQKEVTQQNHIPVEENDIIESEAKDTPINEDLAEDENGKLEMHIEDSEEISKEEEIVEKVTGVEKISHLLTDWEDNDSQSEVLTVVTDNENKDTLNVNTNPNIEKLVSDWDEEDEK